MMAVRIVAAFLFGLTWLAGISEASAAERAYALVIGNNLPPPPPEGEGLVALQFADDDAIRYAELLQRFAGDTRLLTVLDTSTRRRFSDLKPDGIPSLAELRQNLADLNVLADSARRAGDDVTFYVIFSGHGALDRHGEAFLSLIDGPLSRSVLYDEVLSAISADRIHLILDACHAAGVVGVRGKRGFGRSVDAKVSAVPEAEAEEWVRARTLDRFPHVGVLAATTAGEQAHEWSEIQSGVFSHELLSALWGAADVNGDLAIETSEVQAFIASANSRLEDPRARPTVVARAIPADPHAPIIDLSRLERIAWVTGDGAGLGRFHVERADGRRHIDANIGAGRMTVAIPASETAFVRNAHGEYELFASAGQRLDIDGRKPRPVSDATRGSTSAGFRRALFAEPYTPEYYRGFVDSTDAVGVKFSKVAPTPTPKPRPTFAVTAPKLAPATRNVLGESMDDEPRKRPPSDVHRRRAGIAMATIGAAAFVPTVALSWLSLKLRADFNSTALERDATSISNRHKSIRSAAIGVGVTSLVSAVTAAILLGRK